MSVLEMCQATARDKGGKPLCKDPVEAWITVPEAGWRLPSFLVFETILKSLRALLVVAAYSYLRGEV